MRLESKVGESLSGFVISPSVALTATAPSSEGASEMFCVLYDILFRQTERSCFSGAFFYPSSLRGMTIVILWRSQPEKSLRNPSGLWQSQPTCLSHFKPCINIDAVNIYFYLHLRFRVLK